MAASGGSGQRRLGVALYRALLRWGRANADVPFTLRASEVYALAPELRGTALALQDSAAVGPIARAAFEASRCASGEEQAAALDRGIEGVRLLNTVYGQQIKDMRETRWVHSAEAQCSAFQHGVWWQALQCSNVGARLRSRRGMGALLLPKHPQSTSQPSAPAPPLQARPRGPHRRQVCCGPGGGA